LELIVVDDGSTDETRTVLEPYAEKNLLTYICQEHGGVSAARNRGIRAARGDWLAFLDSDDEWLPGKLAAQTEDLARKPGLLISQCQEIWYRGGRRVNPGRKHLKKEGWLFLDSLARCLISPSAVILSPRLLEETGLFDETFPVCEDYDLWLRVTSRYEAGLLDRDLVIRHGGREDQLSSGFGLDRWRIRALKKILAQPHLTGGQREAARLEMERRQKIYEAGLKKRGLVPGEY
jgi:glycosyltransferase involved in cell wall biosynthesis